jgi:CHAD domain-containing protein
MASPVAASDRATGLLQERIRVFFRHLPRALAGKAEDVHQMRVAGRRLRVALPLLACKPEGRRVRRCRRSLGELVSAAGGSRDLDVGVDLFEKRPDEQDPAFLALRRRLRGARTRSRARMVESLLDLEISGLRRDLRRIVARAGEGLFVVFARLRDQRDREAAALLEGLQALAERYEPDSLHRLRIRTRRLRYIAELSAALKDQPSEAPALFKELQEQLGRIQDTHVLAGWLGRQADGETKRGHAEAAAAARRRERELRQESQASHRELLERGPGALLQQALEAMALTRSAA